MATGAKLYGTGVVILFAALVLGGALDGLRDATKRATQRRAIVGHWEDFGTKAGYALPALGGDSIPPQVFLVLSYGCSRCRETVEILEHLDLSTTPVGILLEPPISGSVVEAVTRLALCHPPRDFTDHYRYFDLAGTRGYLTEGLALPDWDDKGAPYTAAQCASSSDSKETLQSGLRLFAEVGIDRVPAWITKRGLHFGVASMATYEALLDSAYRIAGKERTLCSPESTS